MNWREKAHLLICQHVPYELTISHVNMDWLSYLTDSIATALQSAEESGYARGKEYVSQTKIVRVPDGVAIDTSKLVAATAKRGDGT